MVLLGVLPPRKPLTDLRKFGMSDYVGDITQYPKWHINRFMGDPHEGVKC